jgi:TP901 family phage tail tape measure protein
MDRTVRIRYEAIVSQAQGALAGLSRQSGQLARDLERHALSNEAAYRRVGLAVGAMGAGVMVGLKKAADAAISFESTFAGVRKTVDASEAEFARLEAGMRDLATTIPVTVEELNGIGEAAGQLGIAQENILGFTRVMADLGVATNMASTEAATSLARLANITQMPQDQFDRLGATVVDLGNNLATTESEIVDMGLRLAGAGSQIGLTEAQTLGLAGALSSLGVRAEAGGTAISRVMIDIASAVATGSDEVEQFAEIAGMSTEQFVHAWRDDAGGALATFIEGLGRVAVEGGNVFGVLEDIGMADIRVRDSLLRTSGAGDLLRRSIEMGSQAWAENNALTREAAERYATTESRIQIARNEINDLAIDVGQQLTPMIGVGADAVAALAGTLGDLPDPVLKVGAALGALAGVAATGGGALLLLAPQLFRMRQEFQTLGITMGTFRTKALSMAASMAFISAAVWAFSRNAAVARDAAETLARALAMAPAGDGLAGQVRALDVGLQAIEDRDFSWWEKLMGYEYTTADRGAKALADTLRNLAITSPEAAWQLAQAADAAGTLTIAADGSIRVLTDLGEATALTADQAWNLFHAANAAKAAQEGWVGLLPTLAEENATLARNLGMTTEEVERHKAGVDEAKESLQGWIDGFAGAFDAYGQFADHSSTYQRLLDEENTARRKAAEKAGRDYSDMTESASLFLQSIEDDLEAQRDYYANLDTIRRTHGEEVMRWYAEQTAGRPRLLKQLVDEELDVLDDAHATEMTRRGEHATYMLYELNRSGQQVIDDTGELTQAAVEVLAETLGRSTGEVERIFDENNRTVEASMLLLEAMAGKGAAAAVLAMVQRLGLGAGEVARIVAQYGQLLAAGLNPVIAAVGGQPIVVTNSSDILLHRLNPALRNADGNVYAPVGQRENHVAQIAPAGAWRVWAEDETAGEAFVPPIAARRAQGAAAWSAAQPLGVDVREEPLSDTEAPGGELVGAPA